MGVATVDQTKVCHSTNALFYNELTCLQIRLPKPPQRLAAPYPKLRTAVLETVWL